MNEQVNLNKKINPYVDSGLAYLAVVFIFYWIIFLAVYQPHPKKQNKKEEEKVVVYGKLPQMYLPDTLDIPNGCNNPGNITAGVIRYDTLAIGYMVPRNGRKNKFLVFPTPSNGELALRMRIEYSLGSQLSSFLKNYGGYRYINYPCRENKMKPSSIITKDKIEGVAQSIKKHEGWKGGRIISSRTLQIY